MKAAVAHVVDFLFELLSSEIVLAFEAFGCGAAVFGKDCFLEGVLASCWAVLRSGERRFRVVRVVAVEGVGGALSGDCGIAGNLSGATLVGVCESRPAVGRFEADVVQSSA